MTTLKTEMAVELKKLQKPLKKLRKLAGKVHRHPIPDDVHALRTSIRRVRAMFEALALNSQGVGKSTLKDLDRLHKQAGKVRDMDVLAGYSSSIHLKGEKECEVQLLEHLMMTRRKQGRKLYDEVKRLRAGLRDDMKHAAAVLEKLSQRSGANGKPALSDIAGNAARRVTVRLAAPQRLDRNNLHKYRLKVKNLQDVLIVANGSSHTRLVDHLGDVKDAIGEWHDWAGLTAIAGKVLDHKKGCALQTELHRITRRKFEQAMNAVRTLRRRDLANGRRSAKR